MKKVIKGIKQAWYEYGFDCYIEGAHGKSVKPTILGFIWAEVRFRLLSLRCRIFGHKWRSEDYCGPDSGYMGVECTRCGESHGTQLY